MTFQTRAAPAAGTDAAFARAQAEAEAEAEAQRLVRRRARLVVFWRIAVLVGVLGGWELAARMHWIDPFF